MKRATFVHSAWIFGSLVLGLFPRGAGAAIMSVVETGGDNEATDTITAKYTGQIWNVTQANEPFTGAVVGTPYLVTTFVNNAPSFVDRTHRYSNDVSLPLSIPAYLLNNEYIMSGNDNRDNALYNLAVTVNTPSRVYMLIDNRMGDANNANPPTFGAAAMQWILNEGWIATNTGTNRTSNIAVADEVPFDEGSDGTINNWYSVYYRDVAAGTFNLLQADNTGNNMYGVVIAPIPEPTAPVLGGLAAAGLLLARRRRR